MLNRIDFGCPTDGQLLVCLSFQQRHSCLYGFSLCFMPVIEFEVVVVWLCCLCKLVFVFGLVFVFLSVTVYMLTLISFTSDAYG